MKTMSKGKREIQWLIFLANLVAIVAAALLYIPLSQWCPQHDLAIPIRELLLGVLPSAIAAMSALAVVYALFTRKEIRIALGDNPSLSGFAVELVDHMKAIQGQKECKQAENNISGWWEMRDWRDNYPRDMPEDEVAERIAAAKRKSFSSDARLLQSGAVVTGSFSNKQNGGKLAKYELRGEVKGNVFIADWVEVTPDKNFPWFGSVQCIISQGSFEKTMVGRWIGISHNERLVHSGVWEWRQRREADEPSQQDWPTEVS